MEGTSVEARGDRREPADMKNIGYGVTQFTLTEHDDRHDVLTLLERPLNAEESAFQHSAAASTLGSFSMGGVP